MVDELFELKPQKYGMYNDLEILPYMVTNKKLTYIVYGAGDMGGWFCNWYRKVYGISPSFVVEDNPENDNLDGVKVISLNDFQAMSHEPYFVVVAKECYRQPETRAEIASILRENGAVTIFNANRINYQYKIQWYSYIKENKKEFDNIYELLTDETSKETLVEYLKTYVLGQRYAGKTFPEEYKYWGIDSEDNRLFRLTEQEELLNCGGCVGDTIIQYLKGGYPFKKIITVECDEKNVQYLKRTIDLLDDGIRNKIKIDNYFIGEGDNTIDKLYYDEQISLINMDIEGAELDVLRTGIETIKRCRPVLAICAYHKKEDLIELPQFIMENFEGYKLALRKYPSAYWDYIDGIQQINELVLYAIPEERLAVMLNDDKLSI